ncbi:transcription initiation factor TFIID component TAF4 family-domain-containing protein [Phellopilus nigrolimitatus]|nr:transcription initiation factor TFIID component TAF4 family-domain-containing protein [Phellopilus nigrolimitatus]
MMTYQHYGAYGATHYPQAAYASHPHYSQYQTAQPPATAPAPQAPQASQANQPISRQATQANDSESNVDIATLNDALGSAGLDLRAEEETLQRSQDHHMTYRIHEDRSRKQSNGITFDSRIIGNMMREIGTRHKVARIPDDSVSYVALALRMRLQGLLKGMVGAAEHRASAQFDREPSLYDDGTPMWSVIVRRDVKKQLEVLERVDREEEMRVRRERRERADAAAAAQAAQAAGESPSLEGTAPGATGDDSMDAGGTSAKKPKKKKDGPGVTARNMSEDVQKRLSNAVATQAAGLGRGKYAWMNAGSAAPAAKTKAVTPAAPAAPTGGGTTGPQTPSASQAANASSWAKPYVPASAAKTSSSPVPGDEEKTTVTMRDAMFVIERERGHGAGRGSARGWV